MIILSIMFHFYFFSNNQQAVGGFKSGVEYVRWVAEWVFGTITSQGCICTNRLRWKGSFIKLYNVPPLPPLP